MKLIDLLKITKCPLMIKTDSTRFALIDYNKKDKTLIYNPSVLECYYEKEITSFELCEKIVSNNKMTYLKVTLL